MHKKRSVVDEKVQYIAVMLVQCTDTLKICTTTRMVLKAKVIESCFQVKSARIPRDLLDGPEQELTPIKDLSVRPFLLGFHHFLAARAYLKYAFVLKVGESSILKGLSQHCSLSCQKLCKAAAAPLVSICALG